MDKYSRMMVLAEQAMKELDAIGVPYVKPIKWCLSKATSRWAHIQRKKNAVTNKYDYIIKISEVTLDDCVSDENVKDTIIHELIHTLPNCFCHKGDFKKYAQLVNDCYACYHISRVCSVTDMGLTNEAFAKYVKTPTSVYKVVCTCCHKKFIYKRRVKLIKILQSGLTRTSYTCPYCGGNEFILK